MHSLLQIVNEYNELLATQLENQKLVSVFAICSLSAKISSCLVQTVKFRTCLIVVF